MSGYPGPQQKGPNQSHKRWGPIGARALRENWGWSSAASALLGFVVSYIHTTRYADRLGIRVSDLDMTPADHVFAAARTASLIAVAVVVSPAIATLSRHRLIVWWRQPGIAGKVVAVSSCLVPSVLGFALFVGYPRQMLDLASGWSISVNVVAAAVASMATAVALAISALFTDLRPLNERREKRRILLNFVTLLTFFTTAWWVSPTILADGHKRGDASPDFVLSGGAVAADIGRLDDGTCALRIAPRVYVVSGDEATRVVVYGSQPTFTLDESCIVGGLGDFGP